MIEAKGVVMPEALERFTVLYREQYDDHSSPVWRVYDNYGGSLFTTPEDAIESFGSKCYIENVTHYGVIKIEVPNVVFNKQLLKK